MRWESFDAFGWYAGSSSTALVAHLSGKNSRQPGYIGQALRAKAKKLLSILNSSFKHILHKICKFVKNQKKLVIFKNLKLVISVSIH